MTRLPVAAPLAALALALAGRQVNIGGPAGGGVNVGGSKQATEDETALYDRFKSHEGDKATGVLDATAWPLVRHPDEDVIVSAIFALIWQGPVALLAGALVFLVITAFFRSAELGGLFFKGTGPEHARQSRYVYVVAAFHLAYQLRWKAIKTVLVLLAGTIPLMSFVAERRVRADLPRDREAAASGPARRA